MKKTLLFLLSLVALPVYAQGIWDTLNSHQDSLEPQEGTSGSPTVKKPGSEVSTIAVSTAVGSGKCEENDQTSLPLARVISLIQAKNAKLDVNFDPRKGTISVSAPDMISNCSSMLQWSLKEQVIGQQKSYAVEVKLKPCAEPEGDLCEYKVAKVEGGAFKEWERMKLKPTLEGFEECLNKSGVVDGNKFKSSAVYSAPLMEKFNDIYDSGKLLFVSHGPQSAQIKAKYGNFDTIDKCDHFEAIHPEMKSILSSQDEEQLRLSEEAAEVSKCGQYSKVADFIEKYENYSSQLSNVRDRLILEAAQKAAKNFSEGKFSEEDLKVMADFERYIVQPKVLLAKVLYGELTNLQGAEADAKKQQLSEVLKELSSLNGKPYFEAAHTKRLLHEGRFDEAEKLNTMKLTLEAYSKIGTKINNGVLTPEAAADKVVKSRNSFLRDLETEKESYALRTGELTGKEQHYRDLAKSMRWNIETRTANFNGEIQEEYGRMQPGGYCYAYFRNVQKCIQDSTERIQELTDLLKHYNQVDAERAVEYDAQADAYGKLEAEGRRYIATQNGEELPPEKPAEKSKPVDTTVPGRRSSENGYSFEYNPQQQMPQQQMPQQGAMSQNPLAGWQAGGYQQGGFNPYQGYSQNTFMAGLQSGFGQQQPYMGMQSYNGMGGYNAYGGGYSGMGGGYSFNYGGAGIPQQQMSGYGMPGQSGYGMPGQGGFWGQPYGAYNMYSMYGR